MKNSLSSDKNFKAVFDYSSDHDRRYFNTLCFSARCLGHDLMQHVFRGNIFSPAK